MNNLIFAGVDVGGTKISAALVSEQGKILTRVKTATPVKATIREVSAIIKGVLKELAQTKNLQIRHLGGVGIAVPGMVDSIQGKILGAPNVSLSGWNIVRDLEKTLKIKVACGNDVNLGTLAENLFGAAKGYRNVVGIFPGTGVGGGAIVDNKLLTGTHGCATEFGHMIVEKNGPLCGCGNHGCLEAFVGRWAIEKRLRKEINRGKKSIITKLTDGDLSRIKSKVLAKALAKNDRLTKKVMKQAGEALGVGCVSLRHIFDPEIIVLGGGLFEACGDFLLPFVQKELDQDPFFRPLGRLKVVISKLGDDAVLLGAAALVLPSNNF